MANENSCNMRGKGRFPFWITIALIGAFLLIIAIYSFWTSIDQQRVSQQRVLEEARLLTCELEATWNYIDSVQDSINYNSDGRYDFKQVYCSVAGKSVALNFTLDTDREIRYAREDPRIGTDTPDEFESSALAFFEEGGTEYWDVGEYREQTVFRYASVLRMKPGCLKCHGDPMGELDETGYPKEGYKLGGVAGAVSLIIPLEQYQVEAREQALTHIALFAALAAVTLICVAVVNAILARQYKQVENANEKLRKESEYKSTFLATMSHELRTPLASNIALADVWNKSVNKPASQESELINEIRRSSMGLLELVNNTLDAASLEAGRYEVSLSPLDILDVVNSVEHTVTPLARNKDIDFVIDIQNEIPLVLTDSSIINKVLMNLLSNAIKFTESGGSVRLAIDFDWKDSVLTIVVSDAGIGMSEQDLARVFERFRQADSSISRRYGGSGLGLSLVKEMAELLDGSVSVESQVDCGSRFTVRIPCTVIEDGLL